MLRASVLCARRARPITKQITNIECYRRLCHGCCWARRAVELAATESQLRAGGEAGVVLRVEIPRGESGGYEIAVGGVHYPDREAWKCSRTADIRRGRHNGGYGIGNHESGGWFTGIEFQVIEVGSDIEAIRIGVEVKSFQIGPPVEVISRGRNYW